MALYQAVAGNQALAADLNQYYNLLTGVMSGQPVTLADNLYLSSNVPGVWFLDTTPAQSTPNKAFRAYNGTLQLLNNAYTEVLFQVDDVGGMFFGGATRLLTLYDSGGSYLGTTPTDPGGPSFYVQDDVLVGTGLSGYALLQGYTSVGSGAGSAVALKAVNAGGSNIPIALIPTGSGLVYFGYPQGSISNHTLYADPVNFKVGVNNQGGLSPPAQNLLLGGGNGGIVQFDYPTVTGHTTSAGKQLAIADTTGTTYYIPLNS